MESPEHKTNQVMSDRALAELGAPQTAYVRQIDAETARQELARLTSGQEVEFHIEPGQKLYSLHAADGTRLAILDSRKAALEAAWQNEMKLVSVH